MLAHDKLKRLVDRLANAQHTAANAGTYMQELENLAKMTELAAELVGQVADRAVTVSNEMDRLEQASVLRQVRAEYNAAKRQGKRGPDLWELEDVIALARELKH